MSRPVPVTRLVNSFCRVDLLFELNGNHLLVFPVIMLVNRITYKVIKRVIKDKLQCLFLLLILIPLRNCLLQVKR